MMRMIAFAMTLAIVQPVDAQSDAQAALALAAADDAKRITARAVEHNLFLVWIDNTPYMPFNLPDHLGMSAEIYGPWPGYKHVWFATIKNPTPKAIEAALREAEIAYWEERERQAQAKPRPFEPVNADGSEKLPVGSVEALDEVNAKRASLGLRPLIFDEGLTIAAARCAVERARRLMFGHIGDFNYLPSGVRADAAGCAAYANSTWLSCCYDGNYTHAGAAYAVGSDGKRYMHIFVRNEGGTNDQPTYSSGYYVRRGFGLFRRW